MDLRQSLMPCPRRRTTAMWMPSSILLFLLSIQGTVGRPWLPLGGAPPRPTPTSVLVPRGITRSPVPSTPRLERARERFRLYAATTNAHGSCKSSRHQSLFVHLGTQGRLATRFLGDLVAAATASLMVSPFISIVDRAIIQSANGSMTMSASISQGLRVMFTKPMLFLARPDFAVTFCLYGATYLAANTISTIADEMARSDTWPRFVGTTAINMPGSIAKDQALTKLFGVVDSAARVPAASFALFTVRDVSTMAAAFTLPAPMSSKMQKEFGVTRSWADGLSQLVSPGLIQVISTPVHILGLDLYNHPGSSLGDRFRVIKHAFAPAIVLRVARIGVAFGVGGLGNNSIRQKLHDVMVPVRSV